MTRELSTEFGRRLVGLVRNHAIEDCDARLGGELTGSKSEEWIAMSARIGDYEAVAYFVAEFVDIALVALLRAAESADLDLGFRIDDGAPYESIYDISDGTMVADYLGDEGWRERFSKERWSAWI